MDKFPARRQNNPPWSSKNRQGGGQAPKLSTATISTRLGASFTPGLHTVSVQDRASMMGVSGSINQSTRRTVTSFNRKANKASTASEADKLFKLNMVEKSAEQVLSEKLKDIVYDSNACRDMSPDVASAIVDSIRHFSLHQYKLVCVVSLGSLKEKPGVQFGSRCLWNKDTDNFVSVKYSNGSVYAVAMIFGLFFE